MLLVCCGGRSEQTAQTSGSGGIDSSASTSGSSNSSSGFEAGGSQGISAGATSAGGTRVTSAGANAGGSGNIILGGTGGGELADSGTVPSAGAAGTDETACDVGQLVQFIVQGGVGVGQCQLVDPPGPGDMIGIARGAVVIDGEGLVIDNSGLSPNAKRAWLAELSDERWPCLAGQTLGYKCTAAP